MVKIIQRLNKITKTVINKLAKYNKEDLSYEKFQKIESKKYQNQPAADDENFKFHHPYRCTHACFRKR